MKLNGLLKGAFLALLLSLPFTSALAADMVNINTASAEQLASVLVGVGDSKARAIVSDRDENGPFKTIDELARVKGIGSSTVNKNLDRITVQDPQ